ncbi:hypothetical protein EUTSA_v10023121mg, partial [Eutrema salsugineum]
MNVSSYPKTESWEANSSIDCCNWDGVICDTESGKVIRLDLSCSCFHGRLEPSSSLFRLKHLKDLNLAYNNFTLSPISDKFSELMWLERLNLSESSFTGQIPTQILQLTNLLSLDLSSSSSSFLWETSFSGIIPDSIGNLKHLTSLTLQESDFSGRIPSSLGNISNLSRLLLSTNHFTVFNVGRNKLTGNFPSALLNLTKLRFISLSSNQFTGFLPPNIGQLSKLDGFLAGSNSFTGAVPASLFKISSLTNIYLEDNQLTGLLGFENVSLLLNLQYLFMYGNNFRVSPVDLNVLSSLKQLVGLDLSGIPLLTANITSGSSFSSRLQYLYLSGSNITEFPEFIIRDQRNLDSLDLSNNNIKGQVPDWLWRLQTLQIVDLSKNSLSGFNGSSEAVPGSQINTLDLSSNVFEGPLFISSTSIAYLFVSNNNFTGEIPRSICGLTSPIIIDLSDNNFHGLIPRCLGTHMSSLSDLNLCNNSLSGSLPDMFVHTTKLRSIDISHNRLEGKLHASLTGCSALEVLNVESNEITDTFPFQLSSLQKLQVLVLRANKFHGMLDHSAMEMERILTAYTAIDFSGNKIHGQVPESIGLLKELHVLNFSRNAFTGHIPPSLANLTSLESLDVSQNKLSGEIPPKLRDLSSLGWINVSHNQLVGSIPQGTQFQQQSCSSYEGNPRLYGPSLKDICGDIHVPTSSESEEGEEEEEMLSWIAAGLGFAPGVVFGLTIGYIVASYKPE